MMRVAVWLGCTASIYVCGQQVCVSTIDLEREAGPMHQVLKQESIRGNILSICDEDGRAFHRPRQ